MIKTTKTVIGQVFPALTLRNYQLYFFGQSISLIGFWLQNVAIGYLMLQLTHSPFWVGLAATASGLPFLFFSTFAGVFIDRTNKQKLLVWTQVFEATAALILGLAVFTHQITPQIVLFVSFMTGISGSVDLPARLSFIAEMVGKKYIGSAVSMNVAVFNGARFVGPALAGLLIASFGIGWAFILNALSYIPGIMAVLAIRPVETAVPNNETHPIESLKEGVKYSFTHHQLLVIMILASCMGVFIWPYQTLMPVISEVVYHAGPEGLGSLLAVAGLGSLFGAIFTSAYLEKISRVKLVFGGILLGTSSLVGFAFSQNFFLAHLFLFLAGFGIITLSSAQNTLVQLITPPQLRGRVMAVYLTMFVGMMPVGNLLAGYLAEKVSAQFSIFFGALVTFFVGLLFYLSRREKFEHLKS